MPTHGVYFNEEEAPLVEVAAKAAGQKIAPYCADAVRARMKAEGHLPGEPAYDVRAEALAAAGVVGPERVLEALKDLKATAYVAAAQGE